MATLTTSWQSLGSATLYSGITVHLDAKYSSQSTANNTSSVQFRLRSVGTSWRTTSGTAKFTGAYTDSKSCATYPDYIESGDTIYSISKTVKHNDNGSKSLSIGGAVTAYIGNASQTATISNKTATLPKINRLATITSSSDFTDEENPTIKFNNPANYSVYPYLNFYDEAGTKVYSLYRNSSSATSPYTWNITDAERTAMRNATNLQQKYSVSIGVDTYNGSTKVGYNSKSHTMTYVNAEPSQSTTFTETNSKVISVLGTSNANTIIQNVSQLKLTSTPSAKKGANISKASFEHNNISVDDSQSPYEYIFIPVNSKFKVTINDSRKYSVAEEYTKSIVEYLTINIDSFTFKRENPTSSNIILNAQIRYKQATFGSNDNTPTIQWKEENGELHTLSAEDYTINAENNKITISNLVLENVLPYTTPGKFSLYVNDLLTEDKENDYPVTKGIPTCDMGEHDFQVNGELYIADINRENKKEIRDLFFPVGSTYMTSTNTNPKNHLGGEWELIDKEFKDTGFANLSDVVTLNTTNCSGVTRSYRLSGHTMYMDAGFNNKVAVTDNQIVWFTINLAKVGITELPMTYVSSTFSDNGQACAQIQIKSNGEFTTQDVMVRGSSTASLASGASISFDSQLTVPFTNMIDSFCDKFYWQRTG